MFRRLVAARAEKKNAHFIYGALVNQAREAAFYRDMGVSDTIDGRFDMILLHLFLVDLRLEKEGAAFVRLRRFVQEVMVSDMDHSFRELGVGDMSVGKEMKKVGAAWLGRKAAYREALKDPADDKMLYDALLKNVYRGESGAGVAKLVAYIKQAVELMENTILEAPGRSSLTFPELLKEAVPETNLPNNPASGKEND